MKRRAAIVFLAALMLMNGCDKEENTDKKVTAADDNISVTDMSEDEAQSEIVPETDETSVQEDEVSSEKSAEISDSDFEYVLENIAFIGDSVTSGFGGYQKVPASEVFATQGVGPSNIRDYSFQYGDGEYDALTILSCEQPEYVVISMGLNDINTYSPENFSELYMEFAEDAMAVCEESQFYIFSITPVTAECENITNDTINKVNAQLEKTVSDYGSDRLHYVDCNSVLKDEKGFMNSDYSGGDGIHLSSGAYDVVLEQFKKSIS